MGLSWACFARRVTTPAYHHTESIGFIICHVKNWSVVSRKRCQLGHSRVVDRSKYGLTNYNHPCATGIFARETGSYRLVVLTHDVDMYVPRSVDPTIKPQKKQTYLSLHECGDHVRLRLISKDCLGIIFILQIAAGTYPLQANGRSLHTPRYGTEQ